MLSSCFCASASRAAAPAALAFGAVEDAGAFFADVAFAFVLLFFYKLLGGYYFVEDRGPLVRRPRFWNRGFSRSRQPTTVVYEDNR